MYQEVARNRGLTFNCFSNFGAQLFHGITDMDSRMGSLSWLQPSSKLSQLVSLNISVSRDRRLRLGLSGSGLHCYSVFGTGQGSVAGEVQ